MGRTTIAIGWALALTACGGDLTSVSSEGGAEATAAAQGTGVSWSGNGNWSEAGTPCTDNGGCDAGEACLFPTSDCLARTGRCLSIPSLGAVCGTLVTYCGCNGTNVEGVCPACNYTAAGGPRDE